MFADRPRFCVHAESPVPTEGEETLFLPDDVNQVLDQVIVAMSAWNYDGQEAFAMRLALEEAVANAVKHGHQGDTSRPVRLRYLVTAEQVLAEIEDQGAGFDPADVPDPREPENLERSCGRGLLLMRHYLTWVRYSTRGNCVTLCKQRCRS